MLENGDISFESFYAHFQTANLFMCQLSTCLYIKCPPVYTSNVHLFIRQIPTCLYVNCPPVYTSNSICLYVICQSIYTSTFHLFVDYLPVIVVYQLLICLYVTVHLWISNCSPVYSQFFTCFHLKCSPVYASTIQLLIHKLSSCLSTCFTKTLK